MTPVFNEARQAFSEAVGALFINADGQVLATHRRGKPFDLGLPGGKKDPNETDEDTLLREIPEETGLKPVKYHRLWATHDAGSYWFVVFLVYEWEGKLEDREGLLTGWVEPWKLTGDCCSFRQFNKALFDFAGIPAVHP